MFLCFINLFNINNYIKRNFIGLSSKINNLNANCYKIA